jgi:transglutaminase-like putative cysteine protease
MLTRRFCCFLLMLTLLCGVPPAHADTSGASTLQEFASLVEEHTARLEDSFSVPCTWSLTEELKKSSSVGRDITLLSEIMMRAGCGPYSVGWYDDRVLLTKISYYAGWQILRRYEAGETALLSARETETLNRALALAAGASGSDLEKERYIYDTLCSSVTYDLAEDGTGEKDCAIGALLNGRADCDGYADAMVLCCGLAGVPCRYIHGTSTVPSKQRSQDGSHMWNLVYIGGSWLMCDATWGDRDRAEPSYLFFNIGRRDASLSYHWNTDTQFPDIASMADFSAQLMPDQQPAIIYTQEDVYLAARTAASAGKHRLTLYCPEEVFWLTDPDTFTRMLNHGAATHYSYLESGRLYELTDITLPDTPFRFCDSAEEILSAIREYAEAGIRSFSLFFPPALSDQLLSDNSSGLQQVLSRSCLADAGNYRYSPESGSAAFTDVSFASPPVSCASAEEVLSLIRRELPAQPASLTFLTADELSFDAIRGRIADAVYSLGVYSFSFYRSGSRITITDLTYYDNYCLAESETDVSDYMRAVRNSGRRELRVYCSEALYTSLNANNTSAFFRLLQQAGFTEYSVFHLDEYRLLSAEGVR